MKFLKIVFLTFVLISFFSCGSEDDICIGGEATPRVKIKFKTQSSGKMKTLDSLFIAVDYGKGAIPVLASLRRTDSILIPLRIDESPFTKIYAGLTRKTVTSEIKINYTTSSEYVSPACGIKKNYQNVNSTLEVKADVLGVEQNQTQIIDESKTHLFLLF
jgi:hypothetical protein